jgi:D-alanyl-D-alanine carboxypeptidase
VGSLTKTFTAVSVLQLAEQGGLSLGDAASRWISTIPRADTVVIEHLLRHTSGLFNYTDSQGFFALAQTPDGPKVWSPQELIAFATESNHAFAPGSRWGYSNTNYILLGMIVQAIRSQRYSQVLRQGILGPLRMTGTFVDGEDVVPGGFVPGYEPHPQDPAQFTDVTNAIDVSAAWSAGALVSTAADLLTFSRALFGGRLLKTASLGQMMSFIEATDSVYPMVNGYGLGLLSMEIGGRTAYGHVGNIPGYSSLLAHLPDDEMHVVVLTNQNYTRVEGNRVNVEVIVEAVLRAVGT